MMGANLVSRRGSHGANDTETATRLHQDALSRVLLHHRNQSDIIINNNNNNRQLAATEQESSRQALPFSIQASTTSGGGAIVDQYHVNLNLVRKMIAQNLIEILIICVIIIYLVYYFNRISRRPRLIGNRRSKFVQFIKTSLRETLQQRFSPLIYFWGTNPQTALFGYLQGQTSTKEMPRNSFHRQYLYVSDAQYLTSNVDLSRHYQKQRQQKRKQHHLKLKPLAELGPQHLEAEAQQEGLLNQNIRLALDEMLQKGRQKIGNSDQFVVVVGDECSKDQDQSSSSGSSSDSGVFATGGNSPSSGSSSRASSLADVLIDNQQKQQQQQCEKCNCSISSQQPVSNNNNNNNDLLLASQPTSNEHARPMANEQLEFGQCALDWHRSSHKLYHKNKLVALISAGMTTGSDKKYVTDTVQTLEALGYEVCVFIRRGVGGLKLSSAKFFSPAKWRDFEAAVLSIRQQRPGARLVAIGFSFGSIELCRYLSMSGKQSLIDAALLISCPFDPEAGGRNMRKRALNRRIDAYLAKNLGKQLYQAMFAANGQQSAEPTSRNNGQLQQQHQLQISAIKNHNGSLVDLASLPKIKSLVEFEDNFNRILQNYPDSEAYAADSRLQHNLASIETPTLCLSSADDFMAPLKLLPLEQIEANENLCMVLTRRGGHMAFIDGLLWPKRPYFAQRVIGRYMESVRECMFANKRDGLFCQVQQVKTPPTTTTSNHKLDIVQMFTTTTTTNNDSEA